VSAKTPSIGRRVSRCAAIAMPIPIVTRRLFR
jgi:hypothetical protein